MIEKDVPPTPSFDEIMESFEAVLRADRIIKKSIE